MSKKIITSLYEQYKNTPKKLKIICDWDEVIQAHEPYAYFETWKAKGAAREEELRFFPKYFKAFWDNGERLPIKYSNYGSHYKEIGTGSVIFRDKVIEYKNSPNFYQQAPFLTIAEDLLRLIKEKKAQLVFLSAYDKRKFPSGDERKKQIFEETFGKLNSNNLPINFAEMRLIPFESEEKGQSKADWIKQNASDFDIVIDDNPNICRSIVEMREEDDADWDRHGDECMGCSDCWDPKVLFGNMTIIAPYYPAIETQHHSEVLLIKNEVSNLKKEDFSKYGN